MENKKIINKLNNSLNFEIEFSKEQLNDINAENYYNWPQAEFLIEILFKLLLLDREIEYAEWLKISKKYLNNYKPNQDTWNILEYPIDWELYLINFLEGKEIIELARKKAYSLEESYIKDFKINKQNFAEYEELLLFLLTARDYEKAEYYCNQLIEIKNTGLIKIIFDFLNKRKKNENLQVLIGECRNILNKRRLQIADVLTKGFVYFLFYYRELLNYDSVKELLKSMIFGISSLPEK